MRVAVIGAGVAGVTSAYYLASHGHDVTVVDKASTVAAETSHANGGQLSYSFTDALARPSFLPTIPGLVMGLDPAIRVRLLSRPFLLGWGLRFLRQCTSARARDNTVAVLKLALRSADLMASIRAETGVKFSFAAGGKIVLLPESADLTATRATMALKTSNGAQTDLLSMQEAMTIEPALSAFTRRYAGAVYSAEDEVGDARLFTEGLADWLVAQKSVAFRLKTAVSRIVLHAGKLHGIETDSGIIAVDAVVVCAGTASPQLLRPLGIRAPIYPVRGYSVTLPRAAHAPVISITDMAQRILYCPLGGKMRIAGFADFVGNSATADADRTATLKRMAAATAPLLADYAAPDCSPWAGSRPMTPSGQPLTGTSSVPGVYLNCGHGTLGWTVAAATANDLAKVVEYDTNGR